ncbi:hypothetical protein RDV89_08000 [Nocardioides zeae]|uniref:VWA domain-containing protein n=1 Tax=Nocardioides imazamoxiresistens TaxID=3231893 RepID=A0ABU3PUW2_9ACTN|nr:hypothetical protein [Nocardioides zeae]MDT9593006.1 hypothetical protein [Nocardioides zeae]
MGNGAWSDRAYTAAATFRRRSGATDFGYSDDLRRRPTSQWKAHADLDPLGVGVRESRDSAEHPNSTPIAVFFDVTGSMGSVPRQMQAELSKLHGLLQRKGYAEDPQIMFGAIGDADTDYVPLQVGQFESDNRMDEQLRSIFLEGNGGGQMSESYELAAYFMARHTATDAWEKRGRKGYLFVIGDETCKPRLRAKHVRSILGDRVGEDLDTAALWREVQERWEVFFVLPRQTAHYDNPTVNQHWADLLGERLLRLDDPAAVCDLIALTVGLLEDSIDLDEGLDDLRDLGSASGPSVGRALATIGAPARTPAARGATGRLPATVASGLAADADDLA